ncbi:trypsin-like peptidase domain-containing protein [Streptomyces sp. NPDC058773]|uniref:VMAP-C domain-containing protein n=1 Tax=Streptomyces sp. NPDC058773 TaxID=3346632 RepID=UPI0036BD2872
MGWFRAVSGTDDAADPRFRVASVLDAGDGKSAGAAVVLTPHHLLTCAHVVNDALGKEMFEAGRPEGITLRVQTHGPSGAQLHEAQPVHWIPPRRLDDTDGPPGRGEQEWAGDLAVLRVGTALCCPAPPEFRPMRVGQSVRAWHGSALSGSYADVRVKSCDGRIGYMDGALSGMAIGPGYSGGPLWSDAEGAVVGLVTACMLPPVDQPYSSRHVTRRSWGIPWQRIETELRAAGAGALLERPVHDDDPAHAVLADLLANVLPTPMFRAEYARAVAERCGLGHPMDASAPTPEEFARILVTEERALAALTEELRYKDRSAVCALIAAGRLSTVPRLLSPQEHDQLLALVTGLPPEVTELLPDAVRAALPLVAELPYEAGFPELLGSLEQLSGDSRSGPGERVPGLLRAMEFVAVLCPATERARLRMWANRVATRLGLPPYSLRERRADADEWALGRRRRTRPPRLLVHLVRAGADAFGLRLWSDDGMGPHREPTETGRRYTAAQTAEAVLRVLERLCRSAPEGVRPVVEVLLDRDCLELPVDEWEFTEPDGLIPGVLGAEYALVVHCPELLRRNERFLTDWRHRWDHLESAGPLRIMGPSTGVREVYGKLLDRRDAARVSVEVSARARMEIIQLCLAMGVPVVLWDRGPAHEASHAVQHVADAPARALPEQIRSYRAKTLHRPADHPGRPVLAWADPDRALPELQLSEPTELL